MPSKLTVLIPTAGPRGDLLRRTLESLTACEKPGCYCETVIVENGGACGAEAVAREYAQRLNTRYLFVAQGNKSAALNKALSTLDGSLVIFLDDDVRIHRETLCAYARAADGIKGGRFFGGPTEVDYEQPPPDWMREFLPSSARGWQFNGGVPHPVDKPVFLGFNWAAFAHDLREAVGFDTRLGPGAAMHATVGDEAEAQRKLLARGIGGMYVPEARVWHYVPPDRCSPQWTLDRKFRHGVARGLCFDLSGPALFGYPRSIVVRYVRSRIKRALTMLLPNQRIKFKSKYWLNHNRGLLHGVQLQKQNGKHSHGSSSSI